MTKYDYSKQYPYKIGNIVKWATEQGTVTAISGPYSVVVDNRITVPVCLITSHEEPKRKTK